MTALAILDLGYGNTDSIRLAFARLGAEAVLTIDADSPERLVIPGVGAAVSHATHPRRGLIDPIKRRTKPISASASACMMFERTDEGETESLACGKATSGYAPAPAFPYRTWVGRSWRVAAKWPHDGDYVYFAHACLRRLSATAARDAMAPPVPPPSAAAPVGRAIPSRTLLGSRRGLPQGLPVGMILLPAIDLIAGRCVRLAQGDFARETSYSDDPAAAIVDFATQGAEGAHLVDLDGARAGEPRQHDLFVALAKSGITMQVAGGFRTSEQVGRVLDAGVARVVIGSLALTDAPAFSALLDRFGPERLALALDVNLEGDRAIVATHGWERGSGRTLDDVLGDFPAVGHLLVTDIARDGMLTGPNIDLMRTIAIRYPYIALQASGGVSTLDDLAALRTTRAARAIVGKAIWEGRFTVAQGVAHAGG